MDHLPQGAQRGGRANLGWEEGALGLHLTIEDILFADLRIPQA